MGYLRRASFMFFLDANAPAEVEAVDLQQVETAHEEAKVCRIKALIWRRLLDAEYKEDGWLDKFEEQVMLLVLEQVSELSQNLFLIVKRVVETSGSTMYTDAWADWQAEVQDFVKITARDLASSLIRCLMEEQLEDLPRARLDEIVQIPVTQTLDTLAAHFGLDRSRVGSFFAEQYLTQVVALGVALAQGLVQIEAQKPDPVLRQRLHNIVLDVQEAEGDEQVLKKYINKLETFEFRDFAWNVHEILISKAAIPDNSYVPWRRSEDTVRFSGNGFLDVSAQSAGSFQDEAGIIRSDGSTFPCLWVKVVDGWSKEGNWGGYLQITCVTAEGKYIDSTDDWGKEVISRYGKASTNWVDFGDGWVRPVSVKRNKVTFYDMGNYYEIWQGDRQLGRPLIVVGNRLKFEAGATPSKWNVENSTWD